MSDSYKPSVLFVSSTCKGEAMLRQVAAMDCYVLLLIEESLRDEPWPHDIIDEIFYTPDLAQYKDVIHTVAYLCRGRSIDLILPLDEFEVELVAMMREHLRIPGTGVTAVRKFRDKLAMRQLTREADILVPDFIQVKNYDAMREFMLQVPAPWVLKPRSEASAMGIQKIQDAEQLWRALDQLGDLQSYYLLEQFVPGDVYHVDSLVVGGKVQFVSVQKYGKPPMEVYQGGGVFNTRTLGRKTPEARSLARLNAQIVPKTLGLKNGVAHTEFIRAHAGGQFYFLESAARVGGANIADMIEAATGINLWREWGRLEVLQMRGEDYTLPEVKSLYAGLLMTLARQETPDYGAYQDAEIVWFAHKPYHAGLILVAEDPDRVESLLDDYTRRFVADYTAVAAPMGTQRTGI